MSENWHIREAVADIARRAYDLRLQTGNGGNLSARLSDGQRFVIKPSGVSFADCNADELVEVDIATGRAFNGTPSREVLSHLAIYRQRNDVRGIFHSHSPWSVACAQICDELPCVTRHISSKLGCVPVLRSGANPDPAKVASAMGKLIEKKPAIRAFIEAHHGIFSFDTSLKKAFFNAELVEETAQIAMLNRLTSLEAVQ